MQFELNPELFVGSTELIKLERKMEPWEYEQTWDVSDYLTFKQRHPELLVDKTIFLTEVMRSRSQVLVFARGLRMGKTMNLTMFQAFLAHTDLFSHVTSPQVRSGSLYISLPKERVRIRSF